MAAVIAHETTRAWRISAPARVVGAVLCLTGTVAALVGLALFADEADAAAIFPALDPSEVDRALAEWGWSGSTVVAIVLVVQTAMIVATAISASFILWSGTVRVFHAYLAVTMVYFIGTATFATGGWAIIAPEAETIGIAVTAVASAMFFSLTAYFPSGRLAPRWVIAVPVGWGAIIVFSLVVPWWEEGPRWFIVAMSAVAVSLVLTGIVAQIYRYRRLSDRTARQQTKWVLLALVAYLIALLPVFLLPPNALGSLSGLGGVAFQLIRGLVTGVLLALIPVSIAFAIAKYRLFDVDLVIRRTVVGVALVVSIGVIYVAIVGGAAVLWQGSGTAAALIATVVAAVAAHPLRIWLQRRANGWLYGERGDPYGVVSRLGEELRSLESTEQIATRVADTIVDNLRYSSAEVRVTENGVSVRRGDPGARIVTTVPLAREGTQIGALIVGAAPGDRLSAGDQRLVVAVATQAELALSVVRASEVVLESRERILVAREEERQRLYRDLHDGLGPGLAGARQRVDTAMRLRTTHPAESTRLLEEASDAMSDMLVDVRALVHGLRPPSLEELGLAEAVRHAVGSLAEAAGCELTVGSAPPVPAAVEVAAFRIAVEATTNAVRHARATRIDIDFSATNQGIAVEVRDDGRGINDAAPGRGLRSMRERADELGGALTVSDLTPGTLVRATLPLREVAS